MAASDPTRTIATPRGVVERPRDARGPADVPPALLELLHQLEPSEILVGIPFGMDGSAGAMAEEARAFCRALGECTEAEIVEWDERLTTAMAEREIQGMGLPKSRRREKGRADTVAATLMLQAYLRREGAGR